jgi:hypothetical protein
MEIEGRREERTIIANFKSLGSNNHRAGEDGK